MSAASAGKVLMIPKGEYDATTQYKVLDWVLYQGRPYVAKQTTTGNAPIYEPTQANPDNYWQLLLDFPTVVDNVPTQNSNNLVKSGGVYNATADKMKVDGSNAESVIFGGDESGFTFQKFDIAKASGDNESVTLTATIAQANKTNVIVENTLTTHIGGKAWFVNNAVITYIVIDNVSAVAGSTTDDVTVTAHLVNDVSDAISLSNTDVTLVNYSKGAYSLIHGQGSNEDGIYNTVLGVSCSADGEGNFIAGKGDVVDGNYAAVIGSNNYAKGSTQVLGRGLQANTAGQIVVGKYNNNKSTSVFEVGGGDASTRKNILEIKSDGSFSQNDGTDFYKFAKNGGRNGFYDGQNTFHPFEEPLYLTNNSVILSTSQDTDVVFTNPAILETSMIDYYTDPYGYVPKDIVVASGGGSVTLTFEKVSSSETIKVRIAVKNV